MGRETRSSILSGKDGSVWVGEQLLTPVLRWELVKKVSCKAYVANDTGGAWRRLPGARDCTGRLELKLLQNRSAPLEEGWEVVLRLHLDGTGENYYEVPALIERITTQVDIATGEVIGWQVDFAGSGPVLGHGMTPKEPEV